MYTLGYEVSNLSETVIPLLEKVCEVTVTPRKEGGFSVTYQIKHCAPAKSPHTYNGDWTVEGVRKNFYLTNVLPMLRRNGYTLFKRVD